MLGNGGAAAGAGIATLRETDLAAARADLQLPGSRRSLADAAPELLAAVAQASAVDGNLITHNRVAHNADAGIELKNANNTLVEANSVDANGASGIYLAAGTSHTSVALNIVSNNQGYGIKANGLDVAANSWTKNLVFGNLSGGIAVTSGANNGIPAPALTRDGTSVTITTLPGTIVELYSDDGGQGQFFEMRVKATDGTLTLKRSWKGGMVNATATDADGNTSSFSFNRSAVPQGQRVYLPVARR